MDEIQKHSDILKSVDTKNANKHLAENINIGKYGIDQDKIRSKIHEIRKVIFDGKVTIYFIPSTSLRQQVAKGANPLLKDMPDAFKALILEGKGIIIQKMMVYNWLIGKLDKKNAFILSNGELKIADDNISLFNLGKERT